MDISAIAFHHALQHTPHAAREGGAEVDARTFANHCVHCVAVQEDYRLHSEPGAVFFSVTEVEPGSLAFKPLVGA